MKITAGFIVILTAVVFNQDDLTKRMQDVENHMGVHFPAADAGKR